MCTISFVSERERERERGRNRERRGMEKGATERTGSDPHRAAQGQKKSIHTKSIMP